MVLSRDTLNTIMDFLLSNVNRFYFNERHLTCILSQYITENTRWIPYPEYTISYKNMVVSVDLALFEDLDNPPQCLIEVKNGTFKVKDIERDYKKLKKIRRSSDKILIGIFNTAPTFDSVKKLAKKTRSKFIPMILLTEGLQYYCVSNFWGEGGYRSIKRYIDDENEYAMFHISGPVLIINFEANKYKLLEKVLRKLKSIPILRIPNVVRGRAGISRKYSLIAPVDRISPLQNIDVNELKVARNHVNLEFFD